MIDNNRIYLDWPDTPPIKCNKPKLKRIHCERFSLEQDYLLVQSNETYKSLIESGKFTGKKNHALIRRYRKIKQGIIEKTGIEYPSSDEIMNNLWRLHHCSFHSKSTCPMDCEDREKNTIEVKERISLAIKNKNQKVEDEEEDEEVEVEEEVQLEADLEEEKK